MAGALANLAQRLGLRVSLRPLQQAALQPPCFTQRQAAAYSSGKLDEYQDEVRNCRLRRRRLPLPSTPRSNCSTSCRFTLSGSQVENINEVSQDGISSGGYGQAAAVQMADGSERHLLLFIAL